MKHLTALGLSIAAALAAMAFVGAGTASATVLCKTTTTPCGSRVVNGTVIDASLIKETSALLTETGGGTLDKCTGSTAKGKITQEGSSTTTTTGSIEQLTWSGCTFPTTTVTLGKVEAHHITGTDNGTLTADAEIGVTMNTVFFGSCVFGVKSGTDLGTGTGGNPEIVDVNATAVKLSGSAFACPETSKFTATYVNTEPGGTLHFEPS